MNPPPDPPKMDWLIWFLALLPGLAAMLGYAAKALQTMRPKRLPFRFHVGGLILAFVIGNVLYDPLYATIPHEWRSMLYGLVAVGGWASERLVLLIARGLEKFTNFLPNSKEEKNEPQ